MMVALAADPVGDFLKQNPWVIAVVLPVFFVTLWFVVLNFIARMSGWSNLAEHYRTSEPFQGETWSFQSAGMRYMSNYNGCLTFGANVQGMYAAGWGPFRIAATPLLVPWGELTIETKKRWLMPGYELRFQQTPEVYMGGRRTLGENLLRASGKNSSGIRRAPQIG